MHRAVHRPCTLWCDWLTTCFGLSPTAPVTVSICLYVYIYIPSTNLIGPFKFHPRGSPVWKASVNPDWSSVEVSSSAKLWLCLYWGSSPHQAHLFCITALGRVKVVTESEDSEGCPQLSVQSPISSINVRNCNLIYTTPQVDSYSITGNSHLRTYTLVCLASGPT